MGTMIEERQRYSDERFEDLRSRLEISSKICAYKACIYATGSFGRREAGQFSDIDLFIVSLGAAEGDPLWLGRLEEIQIKADLIRATRDAGFPPFSRDGRYLQHHPAPRLVEATGSIEDDATNTFTARLLLLLESRPLVSPAIHKQVVDNVIAEYWTEFPDHADRFMPAYLSNDILRYWRTLCLNYEATTSHKPPTKQGKRRLTNYKLKHSRMLTCFSALLFLLNTYIKKRTVTIPDVQIMVGLTPIERTQSVARNTDNHELINTVGELLNSYERFLMLTNASEESLVDRFSNEQERKMLRSERSHFGDLVYRALRSIGEDDRFFRRLVV